ncbi:MAG: lamin tail domain-containing protein, partial [Phormidesmis sp. FL-bin-119]|nr:lamin tail domain-containing protein [Pedobacter sp.]
NPGSNSADLDKWTFGDAGTKATITNLTIKPGEYLILCPIADTLLYKKFGKTKGISPWPSLGNGGDQITLKSFKQRLVDSVAFSDKWYKSQKKKNGGWSLEKIDLLFNSCTGFYNWASAIDPIGGTPGRVNSLNKPGSSQWNIVIETIEYTSDSTVILTLNSIADTFYLKPAHFIMDNKIGEANAMFVDESYLKIHLKFDSKFKEGINYTLIANSLFNCNGKRTQEPKNQASFTIPIIPEVDYPVVINEIFADPSPQLGLPEVEFVELYNPTGKLVSLQGMSYGDESYQYKFTSGEIAAQSYLILCPKKEISSFSTFGNVLGLPDWPSLGNEKDVVILKNNKGREFQRVAYTAGWYGDSEKKSGGYSLEMVSHLSICTGLQNWLASIDPLGGTPGKQNSVSNLPKDPLKLMKVVLTDSITLLLTFNKTIDSLSASASDNYHINNGIGTPGNAFPLSPAFYKVELKLKKALTSGHFNKIEVKEVRDCMGSHIAKEFNYGEFIMTEKIVKNSILISEILFNPRPGGEDFIEVYNNTDHTLDLQEISIATIVKDTIGTRKPISLKQLLFEPGQYMSFTNAPETIKKSYRIENPDRVLKATLPQFNDGEGTVVLLSKGVRIDELTYTEKMHFQLLKDFEGVSLERSSFKLRSNEAGNFRSATAASGFATPGYKNSQHTEHHFNDDEFSLISKTFSPDNDGFEDLLQVSYRMPAPGMVANAKIFNDKGILIKHLIKNSTLNAEGLFVWDGLNEFNNAAGSGIYFIFAEIFDTSGNVKQFRRSFALAEKLQ